MLPVIGEIPAPLFNTALFWSIFGTGLLAVAGVKLSMPTILPIPDDFLERVHSHKYLLKTCMEGLISNYRYYEYQ